MPDDGIGEDTIPCSKCQNTTNSLLFIVYTASTHVCACNLYMQQATCMQGTRVLLHAVCWHVLQLLRNS